jgi:hypothetical protein
MKKFMQKSLSNAPDIVNRSGPMDGKASKEKNIGLSLMDLLDQHPGVENAMGIGTRRLHPSYGSVEFRM